LPQFKESKAQFRWEYLAVGLTAFAWGLVEKTLIADNAAPVADRVFGSASLGYHPSFFQAWAGVIAYSVQIFFDFSGYSNMALGLSKMFGIKLPINFNSPYKSTSIIDFWRRWHITLSEFLRVYLYFPLGGNRKGKARRYVNLFTTMLLGGLWHGAGWTFIFWGGLHGAYLTVNHAWRDWIKASGRIKEASGLTQLLGGALTFVAVLAAWVFFRADTFATAGRMLTGMAGIRRHNMAAAMPVHITLYELLIVCASLALAWLTPNMQQWMADGNPALETEDVVPVRRWRPEPIYALVVGVLLFISIKTFFASEPSPFLYFNF